MMHILMLFRAFICIYFYILCIVCECVFLYLCLFMCVCVVMCVCLSMLGSSGDSEDCAIGSQGLRVPTQKSYSSSETLKAFDQHQDQTRLELLFTNNP